MTKIFYIEENNEIIGYDPKRERLERILKMPEYSHLEIKETTRPIVNYQFADTDEYIEEQARKEVQELALLSLTRGDVFRALLKAKGVTRAQLREMIVNNETLSDIERELALIDFDEALEFYRGVELINILGAALGFSTKQLDDFFKTNDYTKLVGE